MKTIYLNCEITKFKLVIPDIYYNDIRTLYEKIYIVKRNSFYKWTIIVSEKYHNECIIKTEKESFTNVEHNLIAKVYKDKNIWILGENNKWSIYRKGKKFYIYVEKDNWKKIINTVIRQINHAEHLNYNTLFLHSSSFEYNGNAYVFFGDKGAGKTTMLLYSLKYLKEANLISNDVSLINKHNELLPVYSGLMLSQKSLDMFNISVPKNVSKKEFYYEDDKQKFFISLNLFLSLMNKNICLKSKLKKLFFVELDLSRDGIFRNKIDRSLLFDKFKSQILFEDEDHSDFLSLIKCNKEQYLRKLKLHRIENKIEAIIIGKSVKPVDIIESIL